MSATEFNRKLLTFLDQSPTPFHATQTIANQLLQHGFTQLNEATAWDLTVGGKYFVTRNETSIVAFVLGEKDRGARMVGAHTDSPCLKVKPIPVTTKYDYVQLGVEVYGGALLNPWFDRDLSIAGRVQFEDKTGALCSALINFERPIAIIPSLAIHLDREVNSGRAINAQTQMAPLIAQAGGEDALDFKAVLKNQLEAQGVKDVERVLDYDLSFYDTQSASTLGLNNEFIASARLDNLLSCFVGMEALMNHQPSECTALLVCNDHEEVGSLSTAGASGPFLKSVLERIYGYGEALTLAMNQSMLISTDNAHGIHPNFPEKHDANHAPILNRGAVVKINANQRYATTDQTAAIYRGLCEQKKRPLQHFVSRADIGCGSTIGPLTSGLLGVRTIDVGLPTFGMHSIRELAGTQDAYLLSETLRDFFVLNALPA